MQSLSCTASAPVLPGCFWHDQPVQAPGTAWFYLSWLKCIWSECWGGSHGLLPWGVSSGDVPVLAVGLGSSMCFQAESC